MQPRSAPLYVLALGCPVNVASALLIEPQIAEKIVVVWLGGTTQEWPSAKEFNLQQDLHASRVLFDSGVPILGICYGQQVMTHQLGGRVEAGSDGEWDGEFGRAFLTVTKDCALFDGLWQLGERHQVWMSHGDKVTHFAPGFEIVATSDGAPFAVIADEERKYYGTQFHPEVVHTPDGAKLLANFVHRVCGVAGDWSMGAYRDAKIKDIRARVGDGKVICGLSGGVDSSVAAILIHEAIGSQLTCVFVDHGLLRLNEREQVEKVFGGDHDGVPAASDFFRDFQHAAAAVFLEVEEKFLPVVEDFFREQRRIVLPLIIAATATVATLRGTVAIIGGRSVAIIGGRSVAIPGVRAV